jgi:hypothetical protein
MSAPPSSRRAWQPENKEKNSDVGWPGSVTDLGQNYFPPPRPLAKGVAGGTVVQGGKKNCSGFFSDFVLQFVSNTLIGLGIFPI